MSMENIVSVQIPAEELTGTVTKIKEVDTQLAPHLITLKTEQRREVLPMGDASLPFVEKALEYAKSRPELLPAYIQVDEFEIDVKAVEDLNSLIKPLEQLLAKLKDTQLLSGAEAYKTARSIYSALKSAAEDNAPGAKVMVDDLGKRFQGQGKAKKAA